MNYILLVQRKSDMRSSLQT